MNNRLVLLLLAAVWVCSCADRDAAPAAAAMPATAPTASATTPAPKPAPLVSPEVGKDRAVTFRLKAPNAKEVTIRGQWSKALLPMTKDDKGVWSLTTAPIDAGVWEYSFVLDGLTMIDPANPAVKAQREPRTSILSLPGTPPKSWDFQDVPHGTVHHHDYLSKALGVPREAVVYTPPGYEKDAAAKYPLLVLQHGSGDNQQAWVTLGRANWIFDNLIAAGQAKPMVVLMIYGHQPPETTPNPDPVARRTRWLDAFKHELFDDALPLVESLYRVETDRQQRALAGLSMGGGQALSVGLASLDRFAWIGAFSAAPPDDAMIKPALDDANGTNAKLRLLWIAVGKDDSLHTKNEQLDAKLKEAGIHHDFLLTDGNHSWPIWRQYLTEFVPKLFKP